MSPPGERKAAQKHNVEADQEGWALAQGRGCAKAEDGQRHRAYPV